MKGFLILLILTIYGGQITAQVKVSKKILLNTKQPFKMKSYSNKEPKLIYGQYEISNFYRLAKKSLKKNEINLLVNSKIIFNQNLIKGDFIESLSLDVYEIEKMNKADYLFRVFNELIEDKIVELPDDLIVHKLQNSTFLGFIELPNHKIAFPYKGGLVIAELIR